MSESPNFFVNFLILSCVFSVIVRDFLSGSTLFWSFLAFAAAIFASTVLKSEIFLIFSGVGALAARPVTIFAHRVRAENLSRARLRPFVTRLILSLKSGRGLRESLRREGEGALEARAILNLLEGKASELPTAHWRECAELLLFLDRDPAKVVQQIESFRRKLQVEERFGKRVAQTLAQPKLQAGIIALLYAGLVAFVVTHFTAAEYGIFLVASAALVAAGMFWLLILGRNYRWKV